MCRAVRCRTCDKTTWAGCGSHVAAVKAKVPADQWCDGHPSTPNDNWLSRLLGQRGE